MADNLVIVESPAKARTISKILGSNFSVQSSMGHVRDLPERSLGVDVKNRFKPTYRTNKGRRNVIQKLNSAAKSAKEIYLATDPDREGEAIAWHLAKILEDHCAEGAFKRVAFHEITKKAVQESFDHPGKLDMNLVNAQQARRVLDRIVGYKVSPLLWNNVDGKAKSAGRVQSVALRLICERESKITAFVPKEYWNFMATFAKQETGEKFTARLQKIDSKKVEIGDGETAQATAEDVEQGTYRVTKVADTPKQRRPGPPFITSTLQQAASSNLRFSTKQTMVVAQQLYEGIDTGGGPAGLITYMRTDSVNISTTARDAARDYIQEQFGADYVPAKPNVYKSKKSAQEAHEAIRPTDITMTPDKAARFLESPQLRLYKLIWNRFVASQMAPARLITHTVELENNPNTCRQNYLFQTTADRVIFPGFTKIYDLKDVESDGEREDVQKIPALTEQEPCRLDELGKEQKFTEPPPRFTEATLVRELESNGIGRPSTYAAIVNTIQIREYVTKTKAKLQPTELGMTVCTYLTGNLDNLFDVTFTAKMEDDLDLIEQGTLDWREMLETFYSQFSDWVKTLRSTNVPDKENIYTLMKLFTEDIKWSEPVKRGKRTYDDQKFLHSLKGQLDDGKELSSKQWKAFMIMLVHYEDQLPRLGEVAESLGLAAELQEHRLKREAYAAKNEAADAAGGNDEAIAVADAMAQIKEWEAPVKRRNRTYDDEKLYRSISQQARDGRRLSPAQVNAMKSLFRKYKDQIQDAEKLMTELNIEVESANSANGKVAEGLLTLASDITEWRSAERKKGKAFDEKEFVQSLRQQFELKKSLSDRQLYSLKRLVKSYEAQIPDYEQRFAALESK